MLPLAGIRVAEFCQVLAGPFCGVLLADMGAEVIKVESPEGDLMRAWPPIVEGYSQYFASVNRNKRSVVLDLKDAEGLRHARELALCVDVVIENFRPGVMAKFGLDHATLSKAKPTLVYCSVSAFGQSGPRAKEGGFDMTVQAMSGVMSVTGEAGGRPAKCGIPIADFTAGLYAAYSIAAALLKVRSGGPGEYIDVSMLGGMLGIAHLQTSELFGTGRDPVALGSAHPMNAPYAGFRCRDGYFALAAGTNKLWEATCEGIARPDLARDGRFASPTLRARNQDALRDLLEAEFLKRDAAELLEIFRARGVPCAPINTYSQVLADPQVEHMGWVEDITLPGGAKSKSVISPQRMSGEKLGVYRNPPALGEHTAQVLAELKSDEVTKGNTHMTLPTKMKAVEISTPGAPEVLKPTERPVPQPQKNEVLIKVAAAGVNGPDIMQRKGLYPAPAGASDLPGLEVSGEIVAVGEAAKRWKVGDKVAALTNGGGYAEYCVADAQQCLPIPKGVDIKDAAGLPETFFTVWSNVFIGASLKSGETFLVHGGAGGIGTTAIQLGKAFGAKVLATDSPEARCQICRDLGADRAIDYKQEDFVEVVRVAGGANVILDIVGGPNVEKNFKAASPDARIIQLAFALGSKVEVNLMPVMLKRLSYTGSTLRTRPPAFKARIASELEAQVWPHIEAGRIRVVTHRTFPLAEAAQAHEMMEGAGHVGKILLLP